MDLHVPAQVDSLLRSNALCFLATCHVRDLPDLLIYQFRHSFVIGVFGCQSCLPPGQPLAAPVRSLLISLSCSRTISLI
jgi:hypothetical protein